MLFHCICAYCSLVMCGGDFRVFARVRRALPFIAATLYKENVQNLIFTATLVTNPPTATPTVIKINLDTLGQTKTITPPIPLVQSMTYEVNGNGNPIQVRGVISMSF